LVALPSPIQRTARLILAWWLFALFGSVALAQAAPRADGPSWNSLNPSQRAALAPLERDWSSLDAQRKSKWVQVANRFGKMPADEQRRVQARMAEWAQLTPAERGRARISFQQAKQLSPQERQEAWQAYQALPAEKKRALVDARGQSSVNSTAATRSLAEPTKRNTVPNPALASKQAKAVSPAVVQSNLGATTTLVNRPASPPQHQQPGMPKIAATPTFVDPTTLLPKRGAQGAAVRSAAAASAGAPSPAR
jgi:hypothetical protein